MSVDAHLLTIPEVAQLLSCSRRTVARRISDGTILAFRDRGMVRVPENALAAYVEARVAKRAVAVVNRGTPASRSASKPARRSGRLWDAPDPF